MVAEQDDEGGGRGGYCSWCFQVSDQKLRGTGYILARNVYQCSNCKKETLPCRNPTCNSYARSVPGFHESRCYVHRRLIKSWDDAEGIKELNPTNSYCSNCCEAAEHRICIINPLAGSRTYECMNCHDATVKCTKCNGEAFARRGIGVCIKCQGAIKDWNDIEQNKKSIKLKRKCSWCYEESEHIIRDYSRNSYQCLSCSGMTSQCENCTDTVMKTTSYCARCKILKAKGPEAWDEIMSKKQELDDKYRNWGKIVEEAQRASEFRDFALKRGVIRPFLILIFMHPRVRSYVGMLLGITLSTQKGFLDPHAEAWIILSHSRGLIKRSTTAHEKMALNNCDWFRILRRLMKIYVPAEHWEDYPEDKDTMHVSTTPGSEKMTKIELVLIQYMIDRQTAGFSDVAKKNYQSLKKCKQYDLFNRFLEDFQHFIPEMRTYTDMQLLQAFQQAGLHKNDIELTSKEITSSNILAKYAGVDLKLTGALEHESRFRTTGYDTAKKVSNAGFNIALKSAVSIVAPVLGMMILVNNVTGALLGDTRDVCAMPVREILLYHCILIIRGIDIDELYQAEEEATIDDDFA